MVRQNDLALLASQRPVTTEVYHGARMHKDGTTFSYGSGIN